MTAQEGSGTDAGGTDGSGTDGSGTDADATDVELVRRRHVSDYFRLERREVPPPDGSDRPSAIEGRLPVDDHQRGAGGGMRLGGILTAVDSLGGFMSGLAVLPQWIVTTSCMATVTRLDHVGPLAVRGEVLRRGRTSVVSGFDVVDEGADGVHVAAATMTFAVLDPGDMQLDFARPVVIPMPPLQEGAPGPEEFFAIEPGRGPVTRLLLEDRLRNPWGILHGGAVAMLTDVAACRAAEADRPGTGPMAAAGAVAHYLRPGRVGPLEARCRVLGHRAGATRVRTALHDVGSDDRLVALASVTVVPV